MHKAKKTKMRAFKCRLGIHRWSSKGAYNYLWCKDCRCLLTVNAEIVRIRPL